MYNFKNKVSLKHWAYIVQLWNLGHWNLNLQGDKSDYEKAFTEYPSSLSDTTKDQ